ncbi:MAG: YlmH/Sll1252 family protein [Defluviitaleaceae bacterium]|nr:YlmH/Sll1252 family protein [Defluviitaleaceae bacterium]
MNSGVLTARMEDVAKKAARAGCAASRFITPAEAAEVGRHFGKLHYVNLAFDGGFAEAERVRAVFTNPDWGECRRGELFAVLQIRWNKAYGLAHRDILGALMALGIERDTMGDIACEGNRANLVCLPELGDYVRTSFTKAGRVGVEVSEIGLDELGAKQESLKLRTDTVASLRLDAVMCAAFDLSRSQAAELISAGRVNLDYAQCLQPAREVGEGALISVRGLGRARLTEVGGTSRKGRIFVQFGLF